MINRNEYAKQLMLSVTPFVESGIPHDFKNNHIELEKVIGSRAIGNCPDSDIDLLVIYTPSIEYFRPLFAGRVMGYDNIPSPEILQQKIGGMDYTVYPVSHFFRLAKECNPNILDMLYLGDNLLTYSTGLGRKLIENRRIFLSSKLIYQRFYGFYRSEKNRWWKELETSEDAAKSAYLSLRALWLGTDLLIHGNNYDTSKIDWLDELLEVRSGRIAKNDVNSLMLGAEAMFGLAYTITKLPEVADEDMIKKLLLEFVEI